MSQQYSGRIFYANGHAIANVRVTMFDKDIGNDDDDLTVTAGISEADGRFSVEYDPDRNLDFADIYLPYLRFDYQINGRDKIHNAYIQPFTKEYKLPDLPPTTFIPAEHGFQFINSFPGFWIPYSIPSIPDIPSADNFYGLCGGMIASAYDFLLAGRPIPKRTRRPSRASALHQYLHQRQIDSLGVFGKQVVRFARWMALPDEAVQKRTFKEFAKLKKMLDQGNPSPIGLVYVSTNDTYEIWKNHQVLACSYNENGNDISIQIYDPNFRKKNNVAINCQKQGNSRLTSQQRINRVSTKPVRGWFVMPYTAVVPPANLIIDS